MTPTWHSMRTVGQLRKIKGIPVPNNPDSHYKPIKERSKIGHELVAKIPVNLKKQLPWNDQIKEEVHTFGLTRDLLAEDAPITKLTEALYSDKERDKMNLITKMKAIDEQRTVKKQRLDNILSIKEKKKELREERELKKVQRQNLKRKYILKAEKRIKKARYSVDE
jgi:hypothetical protein